MKKLIMRTFYINVSGMNRQQAKEQILELMEIYNPKNLPDDIRENYFVDDIWLPTTNETKVDVIYPSKFENGDLDLESIEKLIEKLTEIKSQLIKNE